MVPETVTEMERKMVGEKRLQTAAANKGLYYVLVYKIHIYIGWLVTIKIWVIYTIAI